jgi:hypothetical protein|tara:strand:- start:110 stop:346 length:237 start_codon:yes stop_codon:yes gene_type:complete
MDPKIKWAASQLNSKFGDYKSAGKALLAIVNDLQAQLDEAKSASKKAPAKKAPVKKAPAKKSPAKKAPAKKTSAKKNG